MGRVLFALRVEWGVFLAAALEALEGAEVCAHCLQDLARAHVYLDGSGLCLAGDDALVVVEEVGEVLVLHIVPCPLQAASITP